MLTAQRLALDEVPWATLDRLHDRTIFQTRPWLEFVAATQKGAEPVVLAVTDGMTTVGYATGLIVRRLGIRIFGSPFVGWTTSYQGCNVLHDAPRGEVIDSVRRFAFSKLGCAHFEMVDRWATEADMRAPGYEVEPARGFEIDLTQDCETLFNTMTSACRRCIRKAEKSGVVIEEAQDTGFADDYYDQLEDVFAKQRLIPTYPRERVRALVERLLPTGMLLLLRAREPEEGRCIATGIFPAMNQQMFFWGGASWRSDQILRPNELIQWHAMQYWKGRGIALYDMCGGGQYKRKYGCYEIAIPRFRISKYPALNAGRDYARRGLALARRVAAAAKRRA